MRAILFGAVLFLGVGLSAPTQAGKLPGTGPDPAWTDTQKFEWYLGYMSKAVAICRDYAASNALADIAVLSPYGRIGLKGVSGDRFAGGVCGGIRQEAAELLQKKGTYIGYLTEIYGCSSGGACLKPAADPFATNHVCAPELKKVLEHLNVERDCIAGLKTQSKPPGPANGADPHHTARVQLKSCQGSLYIEFNEICAVRQTYTRGDCQVAGVNSY